MDYTLLHWQELKRLCKERNLDTSSCRGKEAYVKLLKENHMESSLIVAASPADMKAVGIDSEGIRIDKLRADLDSLRVPMRIPQRGIKEQRFGGRIHYSIDTNEKTIHFLGNCLGPICTTLQQPDKVIMKIAQQYLGTFTWDAAKAKHIAGMGHQDDERNGYLDDM